MENSRSSIRKRAPPKKVVSSKFDNVEGAKETEIAVPITLPIDGGWGWVVLAAAMGSVGILDGIVLTFGSILHDIAKDLRVDDPSMALAGSLNFSLYLMLGPIASAMINKFGFRLCGMIGGMICSFSCLVSVYAKNYAWFLIFHGICFGIGCSFTVMSACLVVGFYFHKYRRVVMVAVTCGSSVGMMVISPMNLFLAHIGGWRPTILLHSGLLGFLFFLALTYKPLISLTVTSTQDAAASARLVTYLPNEKKTPGGVKPTANVTERVLGAVSNTRFPTAATVVEEPVVTRLPSPGTSTGATKPRLTLLAKGLTKEQLKQVKSIIYKGIGDDQPALDIKIEEQDDHDQKKSCWGRLFHWNSRPLYRDDAFYDGKMNKLPQYRKIQTAAGKKTSGLEYQMEVTRAATLQDLRDRRGVCTAAIKRVLATMFDMGLLRTSSFKIICLAGVCNYLGLLTPFTYLHHRNLQHGMSPDHCRYLVAVIGAFNACGRLMWSVLATKVSPSYLYSAGLLVAGTSTMLSSLSYTVLYQYIYCAFFGMTICVSNAMRGLMIVDLYGLERLTNGTGMLLLFMGIGNVFSTPVAGLIRNTFGYTVSFYFAGFFLAMGGCLAASVKIIRKREIKKKVQQDQNDNQKGEKSNPTATEKGHQDSVTVDHDPKTTKPKDQNKT